MGIATMLLGEAVYRDERNPPGIIVAMDRSPDTGAMMAFVVFNGSDRIEEHQLRALTLVDPGAVSDRAQRVETNVVLGLT